MTIMASASRAVQEPAALPTLVTGPGCGSAFADRTHAKRRRVCATREEQAEEFVKWAVENFVNYFLALRLRMSVLGTPFRQRKRWTAV